MKHLDTSSKNKLTKTIETFIFVLVIILVFIFTVGFNLLLKTSVFIANLFAKNQPQSLNKTIDLYGSIEIDSIPTATNSGTFIVTGTLVNYDKLEFFLNDEKVKTKSINVNDTFTEEIGELIEGENDFYIRATNTETKSKKNTAIYTIVLKESKPKLEINQPQDNDKTSQQEIIVKGSTDKEVFIRINYLPVVVDAIGNFETSVRLKDGENIIKITASDIAGNIEEKTLKINYQQD